MNIDTHKHQGEKEILAKVTSIVDQRTAQVEVVRYHKHPLYKKAVKRTKRFAVERGGYEVIVGDLISIRESKPISKTKHYRMTKKSNT